VPRAASERFDLPQQIENNNLNKEKPALRMQDGLLP
jgi:hypothetical protein